MSLPVQVVYHDRYRRYYFGPQHPFSPVRLEMLTELIEALGTPFEPTAPPLATRAEVAWVHDASFIDAVEAASGGTPPPGAARFGLDTPDVPVFAGMDEAARGLVGGTLHAARLVAAGEAARVLQLGGGLHHAQHALASGFCVYSDLAVAIEALRREGLRVAYIDVDVHHGDGVQALFYDVPDVLTISLHESGQYLFPGTGAIHELGAGAGRGFKLNVPLEPATTDEGFLDAFEHVVPHSLAWFGPDVLVVQCGADAHHQDPLAHLNLTTHGFERLFRRLVALAAEHTGGRAVFTLGGGYDTDATTRIWTLLFHVLAEQPLPDALPAAWLTRWEASLGRSLTPTLHDPPDRRPPAPSELVQHQNASVCRRLMEQAASAWH